MLIPIAQLDGAPPLHGWLLSVGGWLNAPRARPGPALFRGEAATTAPALLGGLAAAGMILAGERLVGFFVHVGG